MTTLPNTAIGLNSANISDANLNSATWNYVSGNKMSSDKASAEPLVSKVRAKLRKDKDAPTESLHAEKGETPIPRGTVAKDAMLRRSILQMSLAPHISRGAMSKVKSPSRIG